MAFRFFKRVPRGVWQTLRGKTMICHVRMALANLSQGQDSIATLQARLSGQVEIGVVIASFVKLVPWRQCVPGKMRPGRAVNAQTKSS